MAESIVFVVDIDPEVAQEGEACMGPVVRGAERSCMGHWDQGSGLKWRTPPGAMQPCELGREKMSMATLCLSISGSRGWEDHVLSVTCTSTQPQELLPASSCTPTKDQGAIMHTPA